MGCLHFLYNGPRNLSRHRKGIRPQCSGRCDENIKAQLAGKQPSKTGRVINREVGTKTTSPKLLLPIWPSLKGGQMFLLWGVFWMALYKSLTQLVYLDCFVPLDYSSHFSKRSLRAWVWFLSMMILLWGTNSSKMSPTIVRPVIRKTSHRKMQSSPSRDV